LDDFFDKLQSIAKKLGKKHGNLPYKHLQSRGRLSLLKVNDILEFKAILAAVCGAELEHLLTQTKEQSKTLS